MYQQRKDGSFRMRASFYISPAQVEAINAICQRESLSFGAVCAEAIDLAIRIDANCQEDPAGKHDRPPLWMKDPRDPVRSARASNDFTHAA